MTPGPLEYQVLPSPGAVLLFGDDGAADAVHRNLDRIGELCTSDRAIQATLSSRPLRSPARRPPVLGARAGVFAEPQALISAVADCMGTR